MIQTHPDRQETMKFVDIRCDLHASNMCSRLLTEAVFLFVEDALKVGFPVKAVDEN